MRRGIFNFDLIVLIGIVVLVNLPFLTGRCMPVHDTKCMLGIFDYFYSNFFFTGELPRWMAYGLYGEDASFYHVQVMSGASYLAFFLGRCLGVTDSLFLFAATHCLEQQLLLLGLYLLCRKLFRERITVFCICLTAVSTVVWHEQLYFNFRMYYLLPLAFYFLIRLREEGKGEFGWFTGIVYLLGPLGSPPYFYPLWALILTVFSVSLFWNNFRILLRMLEFQRKTIFSALLFLALAILFGGSLYKIQDNFIFLGASRSIDSGRVSLPIFLTYGRSDLSVLWNELLIPSANLEGELGRIGMDDYVGLVTIFFLPLAILKIDCYKARAFALTAVAVFALSRGGLITCIAYLYPGMWLFRHVSFTTAILKLLMLILAGIGLDFFISHIKDGSVVKFLDRRNFFLMLLIILLYMDLYLSATFSEVIQIGRLDSWTLLAAIFPVLRGELLIALVFMVWQLRGLLPSEANIKQTKVLGMIVACVVLDCTLFQVELVSHLNLGMSRNHFPVLKENFNLTRLHFQDRLLLKSEAWFSPAASPPKTTEYQIACSSALQWDSPPASFRMEWFPKNVWRLQRALANNPADFDIICGSKTPRVRILSQTQPVATDEEGLALLGSKIGWDKNLILTAPADIRSLPNSPPSNDVSTQVIIPTEFSANTISFNFFLKSAQPAWLVYADAWSSGWQATVNGTPTPVLKAYTAFKAVRLQPGTNQVDLYYHKGFPSVCLSIFATTAGIATAVALLGLVWLAISEPFQTVRLGNPPHSC